MSVTTAAHAAPATDTITERTPVTPLVVDGVKAAGVAGAATTTVAAAADVLGMSPVVGGAPIPAFGFAVLTVIFSVVGLALAVVLAVAARRPRTAFVRTTIVLTVLSLVPDITAEATTTTKLLLMLTHVVAAAIVIPAIARRLS
ncbi:DUF6069 family protein [Actinomycetospora straminea]|uniref:Uncharacterized protein n=1 Tax=Actinomycetospora straminea TaxID=663607 RepID=A0ABP9EDB8_9PSEU|nr:DUF6069 family protein [Actinomycetospora straminea]MDD7934361.1 DUF6069 family protein [Actinomycetospora straminea]